MVVTCCLLVSRRGVAFCYISKVVPGAMRHHLECFAYGKTFTSKWYLVGDVCIFILLVAVLKRTSPLWLTTAATDNIIIASIVNRFPYSQWCFANSAARLTILPCSRCASNDSASCDDKVLCMPSKPVVYDQNDFLHRSLKRTTLSDCSPLLFE
jgi:hypothetical protein